MLNPTKKPRIPYITELLDKEDGPVVAASDYMKMVPDQVSRWVPNGLFSLGTDGYGRSDTREMLRRFFEVDAESITIAVLRQLARRGKIKLAEVEKAIKDLDFDARKPDPSVS